jgi:hypothetical protein
MCNASEEDQGTPSQNPVRPCRTASWQPVGVLTDSTLRGIVDLSDPADPLISPKTRARSRKCRTRHRSILDKFPSPIADNPLCSSMIGYHDRISATVLSVESQNLGYVPGMKMHAISSAISRTSAFSTTVAGPPHLSVSRLFGIIVAGYVDRDPQGREALGPADRAADENSRPSSTYRFLGIEKGP